MNQILVMKKWSMAGVMVMVFILPGTAWTQSIKRQSISSYGSSGLTENILVGQTAGQSFHTSVGSIGVTVAQGFQQPVLFAVKEISNPFENNLNIVVFPNPASRSVTLASEEETGPSVITVSDVNGRFILSEKVPNLSSHTIHCSSWANGMYLITIHDSKQNSKTLKLIISN
jgi:hypothetical protein